MSRRRASLALVPPSTALPVARPKTLADMAPLFLRWFEFVRMRSPATIAGYGFDLRIFLEFAQKAKLELANDVRFQQFYLGYLRAERGSSISTANRHLHTLRAFWRYLVREGLATGNPAADVFVLPKEHRLSSYLTIPQQEQLLTVLEAGQGLAAKRDLALVTTGLFSGLRCNELANLQLSHLDFEAKILRVIQGKGRKDTANCRSCRASRASSAPTSRRPARCSSAGLPALSRSPCLVSASTGTSSSGSTASGNGRSARTRGKRPSRSIARSKHPGTSPRMSS